MKNYTHYYPHVAKKFCQTIIYHRKRKNISQQKLAELADLHLNTLSKIERGICMPSFIVALKISKILEISLDEIMHYMAEDANV